MASILNDNININPTIAESQTVVTVALMASVAYEYLYTANWPGYIQDLLFGLAKKHLTPKEFQKYTHNIEDYFRGRILEFHVDNICEELCAYIGTIFVTVHRVDETLTGSNVYYFRDDKEQLILIVAFNRPGGSIG